MIESLAMVAGDKIKSAASHPVIGKKTTTFTTKPATKRKGEIVIVEEKSLQIRTWELALGAGLGLIGYVIVTGNLPGGGVRDIGKGGLLNDILDVVGIQAFGL